MVDHSFSSTAIVVYHWYMWR